MTLQELIANLNLTVLTAPHDLNAVTPRGGYMSDLLSCVMVGAQPGNIWITLQAHMNVVAVAALREVSAVIITENSQPEEDVIEKANQQNVILLSTSESNYQIAGKLWELGIK
ncbi:MAG TPA: DRTGG domain-containing protein [Anaerolineales bacterium]|nr:DRTGG domain-containing protein [Anaerolineales bacterium]